LAVALAAGAQTTFAFAGPHDALISKHAVANGVPEELVRRVVRIESRGNAAAAHAGNYGLMQIRLGTARSMGYSGDTTGLLDADTNLTYAVRYLAGAYRAAGCDADLTVKYYQRGYYGAARRECGESPAAMQLAQAETKPGAKLKRDAAPANIKSEVATAKPADVIKPKVVRTEIIATSKSGAPSARPVGSFEPSRVPPPAPSVAAAASPLNKEPASNANGAQPDAAERTAKFELASVPMPPVRPELDSAPKPTLKPVHRIERARKKSKVETQSRPGGKPKIEERTTTSKFNIEDPAGVVTFLKKLVTPDKKPRKALEADADTPR
jgi:hypothetical protein